MCSLFPRFFHASTQVLPTQQLVVTAPPATVCPNAVAALEAAKPTGLPSRAACYFACERPENAIRFLDAELRYKGQPLGQPMYMYEIEFPAGHHKGAMALIAAIESKLKVGSPPDRAIAEYWHPTLKWQFFEVFGPEIQIVQQVATPGLVELSVGTFRYQNDHALAAGL
jgi:hypothetical protein